MNKVCVYAISKNEEQFVDRWMDSVGMADAVYVLDTGSTDGTAEKLRKRGAIVDVRTVQPWRFDAARNLAIDGCPPDCNVLFSIDLDEVIAEKDWKERLLAVWGENNRGRYSYVWDHMPDGSDGTKFTYEKLHNPDYEWYLPCHEILRRKKGRWGEDRWAAVPITVHHWPDGRKPRSDYLPLLALAVAEEPNNDRVAHYFGRELYFRALWADAARELMRHLSMPAARWEDERCASMTMIARCHEMLKNDAEAERWHLRACAEAPHLREPWVEMARFCNERQRFPLGYGLAKRALQITDRPASYVTKPYAWNEGVYDLTSTAAYYIGLKPESLGCARKALELAPWDGRLKENVRIIERMSPELSAAAPMPKIIEREAWALDPKMGLLIATHAAAPYVHLALAVRNKFYPDVPCLVVDDGSDQRERIEAVCQRYGASFHCNPVNMGHTGGDLTAFATGLRWAASLGLDVLAKMSRRFVPRTDWRPSLRKAIQETQHATYAGVSDPTWSFRTECCALHVARWLPYAGDMEEAAKGGWMWVERWMEDRAGFVPWGTGGLRCAARWEFVGLGKWVESDTHLWHDTAAPETYHSLATSLGLIEYAVGDFKV